MNLEHIVGYLPYGLKCKFEHDDGNYAIGKVTRMKFLKNVTLIYIGHSTMRSKQFYFGEKVEGHHWFPILRPLSDLIKPITMDGKEFVPIEEIFYWELSEWTSLDKKDFVFNEGITEESKLRFVYFLDDDNDIEFDFSKNIGFLPHELIQLLYQWHFDIHGLIESGEAIDINTLEEK